MLNPAHALLLIGNLCLCVCQRGGASSCICVSSVVGSAVICCVIQHVVWLVVHHRDTGEVIRPAVCPVWMLIPLSHDVTGQQVSCYRQTDLKHTGTLQLLTCQIYHSKAGLKLKHLLEWSVGHEVATSHQRLMTASVLEIFQLHFCAIGGSNDQFLYMSYKGGKLKEQ